MRPFVAALLLCGACGRAWFLDRPIEWREHDTQPIPPPRRQALSIHWSALRDVVFLPLDRAFVLDYGVEAENVNALDEVCDSTWFEDRRRDARDPHPHSFSAEQMRAGAVLPDDEPVAPLTVVKAKDIGSTPGFVAVDARGVRYLVKLDAPGPVGLATATELVVSRLAWAFGWWVPSLTLVDFDPKQIRWAPGATHTTLNGEVEPYTLQMHERMLRTTPRVGDQIRLLASRWLDGTNIGSFAYVGRRADDPNDHFDHGNRRDVRGYGIFAAWVNDVDTLQNNTLDLYVGKPGRGYVVHYHQDVGGAFGTWAAGAEPSWMGYEGYFDLDRIMSGLGTFGLFPRTWEGDLFLRERADDTRRWPVLAGFSAAHFNPRAWRPVIANPAFDRLTDRDRYWGAKRLAAFSADEVRAAISAGRYDADTAERLFQVLWERRRRILDTYLRRVAALDYFRVAEGNLCFDDLFAAARLGGASTYHARLRDGAARSIAWHGQVGCVVLTGHAGYRVFEFGVHRGRGRTARVRVHVIEDGTGARILGVER
jgi:hypothetical protein